MAAIAATSLLVLASPAAAALTQESKTANLERPNRQDVTVRCANDAHVGFGGFKLDTKAPFGSGPLAFPDAMGPKGSAVDRWTFTAHNDSGSNDAKQTSLAYCFKGNKPVVKKATGTIPADTTGSPVEVAAHCPQGKTLIGGGYATNAQVSTGGEVVIVYLTRGSGQSWIAGVINEKHEDVKVTAIAICGGGRSPSKLSDGVAVHGNDEATVGVSCPQGKNVLFAGYNAEYDFDEGRAAFPIALFRPSKRQVRGTAAHNDLPPFDDTASFVVDAYCR